MKRIIALVLCAVMLVTALASCVGNANGSTTTTTTTKPEVPVEYPIEVESTAEVVEHDKGVISVSQNSKVNFMCLTDKDPYAYKVGEDVEFNISLRLGASYVKCENFRVTLRHDGIKGKEEFLVSGETGCVKVITQVAQPGFVIIDVEALDASGNVLENADVLHGGAGAEIEKLTHNGDEPADFDEFWNTAVAELMAIDPEIIEFQKIETKGGYDYYDVKILAVDDSAAFSNEIKKEAHNFVSGTISVPVGAEPRSCGFKMTFDGHGVMKSEADGLKNTIVFDVLAHSIEANEKASYYTGKKNLLGAYGMGYQNTDDPNEIYFKNMVLRNLQACRFLVSYFGENGEGGNLWNGKDFELDGYSQGGFQVTAVAALADRVGVTISRATIGAPWLCDMGSYCTGDTTVIQSQWWPTGKYETLAYFDSSLLARRVTCESAVVIGLGDETTPPASVTILYFNLGSDDKQIIFVQNKSHGTESPTSKRYTYK